MFTYRGFATLELSQKQKSEYRPNDVYDRESFTFKNLTGRLDPQINTILKGSLGSEFVLSSVVGLRLSDRKENTIEVDFLVFLERREKDTSDWYKTYTPQKLSQDLFTIFSEFRAGSGDLPLATFQNSAGAFDLDECTARGHSDCNRDAKCINLEGTFECLCKPGFEDNSHDPTRKGKVLVQQPYCIMKFSNHKNLRLA